MKISKGYLEITPKEVEEILNYPTTYSNYILVLIERISGTSLPKLKIEKHDL